jgi:hypothetical protein
VYKPFRESASSGLATWGRFAICGGYLTAR